MSLLNDVKQSVRQLARQPAFAVTAVLTLAIGMGVNAVAFSVVNGFLFKRSPIASPEGAGRIATLPGGDESGYASLAEYRRFAEATRGALDLAAEGRLSVGWRHDGTTETAWVLFVSSNYFPMVNARAIAGRLDVSPAAASGRSPSVVVGERFWRRSLNAAPIAGLTLQLNGTETAVAGVIPDSFTGPSGIYSPDVWMPLEDLELFKTAAALRQQDARWLFVFGRVQSGVTVPEVQSRVNAAVAAMARDWPATHRERGARFRLFSEGNSELRLLGRGAAVAMGIIGLVLLLACFNVANLLLARAVERERDMAIRAAVGARPSHLVRLAAVDGFIVALLAGAAALMLASWTQALVGSFAIPIEEPHHVDMTPDATVVSFVAALVLVAGVLPGLWPAIAAARVDVARVLGSQSASGARPSRMRHWLVGAQIAGSTAFLAIAALFIQSYGKLSVADMGFDRDRIVIAEVEPASHGYDAARSEQYVQSLVSRMAALPGVDRVAVADRAPFFIGFERMTPVSAAQVCGSAGCPKYATLAVGPGYFSAMGIAMAEGREFRPDDAAGTAIVNQPLARKLWPDGRAAGRTIRVGDRGVTTMVAGVTARTHTRGLDRERPTIYFPVRSEQYERSVTIVVHTASAPAALIRPILDAAHALDPDVPMSSVQTMAQRMAVPLWPFRTVSWLFSICGILALTLGTVGLAGVIIHAVNRRRREFGVRLSIGASPRDLVVDVLRGGIRLLIPGAIAGTLLAAIAARLVRAAFMGVNVLNPATYAAVVAVEALVVIVACISPALRASRTDPLVALRSE
jgi:putative ABC transport system permease protein